MTYARNKEISDIKLILLFALFGFCLVFFPSTLFTFYAHPTWFIKPVYSPSYKTHSGYKTYTDPFYKFSFSYSPSKDISTEHGLFIGEYLRGRQYLNGQIFSSSVWITSKSKEEINADTFEKAKNTIIQNFKNDFTDDNYMLPKSGTYSSRVIDVKEFHFTTPHGLKGVEVYIEQENTNKTFNNNERFEFGPIFIINASQNPKLQIIVVNLFSEPDWDTISTAKTFVNTLQIN